MNYNFGQVWCLSMDNFATLNYEGQNITKVRRVDGWRNVVQGLSSKATTEKKMSSFDTIINSTTGGPKINQYELGNSRSDTP